MNKFIYILIAVGMLTFWQGCDKDDDYKENSIETPEQKDIPEGFFEVIFSSPTSKAPIIGQDNRISDLRYLLFKSTGEFVKERHILAKNDPTGIWPISTVKDTLIKGDYKAVFVGNTEKTLFPYANNNFSEVISGYQAGYSEGRIILPNAEFSDSTEYYMSKVTFSDESSHPTILLQRIIGLIKLHRNFVDASKALDTLTKNIATGTNSKNLIRNQVSSILPGLIKLKLNTGSPLDDIQYNLLGGLDKLVDTLSKNLIDPVTNRLYDVLLHQLVSELGTALTGNADQNGLLSFLGVLLNPWVASNVEEAVVSINNFPKSMDFDLVVKDHYSGINKFKYTFPKDAIYQEKNIFIKNFHGPIDVRKINVMKKGIISGILIDQAIESWILSGTFIDVDDPILSDNQTNKKFKSDYSFVDLGLKSYSVQGDGVKNLSLTTTLGNVANIDGIIGNIPLLGGLLEALLDSLILNPLKTITVTVPLNIPVLGVNNLKLSGGWSPSVNYQ